MIQTNKRKQPYGDLKQNKYDILQGFYNSTAHLSIKISGALPGKMLARS